MSTTRIAEVVDYRVGEFEKRIAKLQKKAAKYGIQEPTATKINEYDRPIFEVIETFYGEEQTTNIIGYDHMVVFEVTHADFKLNGDWRFVGAVEHAGFANLVHLFLDEDEEYLIPKSKRASLRIDHQKCDHCGIKRPRNNTYLLLNNQNKLVQVGSTCMKDYLGIDAAKSIDVLRTLMTENWEYYGESSSANMYYGLMDILVLAREEIIEHGYIPSREEGSTKMGVLTILGALTSKSSAIRNEARQHLEECRSKHSEYAQTALEWLQSNKDDSEYILNLKAICELSAVDPKHIGYVVSLPKAYSKYLGDLRKEPKIDYDALANEAGYFGNIGDSIGGNLTKKDRESQRKSWFFSAQSGKVIAVSDTGKRALASQNLRQDMLYGIPVEVVFTTTFETLYGTTTLIKMRSLMTNHYFTWFKTGYWSSDKFNCSDDLVGQNFQLKGSIKDHSEYRGTKQTIVNRCTLIGS